MQVIISTFHALKALNSMCFSFFSVLEEQANVMSRDSDTSGLTVFETEVL